MLTTDFVYEFGKVPNSGRDSGFWTYLALHRYLHHPTKKINKMFAIRDLVDFQLHEDDR